MNSGIHQVIFYLDDLEQKGVFRILNTALDVLKNIGETYTAEDMAQIGAGQSRFRLVLSLSESPAALITAGDFFI